jgi:hypothetical protein
MGTYRSGTSLACQILDALDVDFGPASIMKPPPDRFNPGGYFQRRNVTTANVHLLEMAGGSEEVPPEPETLAVHARSSDLESLGPLWDPASQLVGIKDPRFCATLLTWLESGVFGDRQVRVLRISRDRDAVASSIIRHREVGAMCDFDSARARRMAVMYEERAAWHQERLELPVLHVQFEDLMSRPTESVANIAGFVHAGGTADHEAALRRIGKRRALMRHYYRKIRDPRLLLETVRKTMERTRG